MVALNTQEMLGRARERMEDQTVPKERAKEWEKMKKYLKRWQRNGWFPTVTAPTAAHRCRVWREAAKAKNNAVADHVGASRLNKFGRKRALNMEEKRCSDTKRLLTYWKAVDPTTLPDAVGLPEVLKETDFKPTPRSNTPVYTPVYPSVPTEARGQAELSSPPPPYAKKKSSTIYPSFSKPSIQAPVYRVNGGTLDMDVEREEENRSGDDLDEDMIELKVSTPESGHDEPGHMGGGEGETSRPFSDAQEPEMLPLEQRYERVDKQLLWDHEWSENHQLLTPGKQERQGKDADKEKTIGEVEHARAEQQEQERQEKSEEEKEGNLGSGEYKAKGYLFLTPRNRRRAATSDDDTYDDTDEDRRERVRGAAGGRSPPRRSTRDRKKPERYGEHFYPVRGKMPPLAQTQQYPLLVKSNGQAEFVPWGHRDMDALEKALPPLAGGANPWIRLFEKLTAADKLALGDIRAMIIRAEGTAQLNILEVSTGTTNRGDETPFDNFRGVFWTAMRSIWATKPNMNSLSGLKIKSEEETHQYLKRAEVEWFMATGGRHDSNEATIVVWRHTVQKGLPPSVQTALGGVVGLSNMDDAMWREHLAHYNQRHLTEETSGEEDMKRMTQRLLKLQLAEADREINRKHLAKKQMVVAEAQSPQQPQHPVAPPAPCQQSPAVPAPTVVYYQPSPSYRGRGRGRARASNRGRGNYRGGYERPAGRGECYVCGSESHWARDCSQRAGRPISATPQHAPFSPHQQYPGPGPTGPSGPPLMRPQHQQMPMMPPGQWEGTYQQGEY
ncbi:hypothetical protein VZT92_015031 [Zoarces viviparus]|uniref:CCHC-type domain-containing protein n=1 Tax=Zoarces viviparus TaxID=48416 RepID=A0AAW1EVP3_ZOAVI